MLRPTREISLNQTGRLEPAAKDHESIFFVPASESTSFPPFSGDSLVLLLQRVLEFPCDVRFPSLQPGHFPSLSLEEIFSFGTPSIDDYRLSFPPIFRAFSTFVDVHPTRAREVPGAFFSIRALSSPAPPPDQRDSRSMPLLFFFMENSNLMECSPGTLIINVTFDWYPAVFRFQGVFPTRPSERPRTIPFFFQQR